MPDNQRSGFIGKVITALRKEFWTIFRFGLVGGSSALFKIGCYAVISRILWTSGSRSVQNVLALGIAMIYNYSLHRLWTFKHQKSTKGSAVRYVLVVVAASLMDAGLFYLGHSVWHVYDFLVLAVIPFVVAVFTFLGHRYYTFRGTPSEGHCHPVPDSTL
jgi:putative flippase GtrA